LHVRTAGYLQKLFDYQKYEMHYAN
jgi:hypothetical protein